MREPSQRLGGLPLNVAAVLAFAACTTTIEIKDREIPDSAILPIESSGAVAALGARSRIGR